MRRWDFGKLILSRLSLAGLEVVAGTRSRTPNGEDYSVTFRFMEKELVSRFSLDRPSACVL